ncbi:MAG: VOC family protein [Alphaproteobacteria bacterium]
MGLRRLDHVNIRTSNLKGMVDFYSRVLGLSVGRRPDFPFPGAWLYCGDDAIIHLIEVSEQPLPYKRDQQLEHFAITADDMDQLTRTLDGEGIDYWLADVPGFPITQVNLHDPDGNHLHIDFTPG